MRILVHIPGGADIGATTRRGHYEQRWAALPPVGSRRSAFLLGSAESRPVPLVTALATGRSWDRVGLVVTDTTAPLGRVLADELTRTSTYGRALPAAQTLPAAATLTADAAREVVGRWLDGHLHADPGAEVDLVVAGGANAFAVGVLFATLERGLPLTFLLSDQEGRPGVFELADALGDDADLDNWLVRHCYYSPMIVRDRDHEDLWRDLAARQAFTGEDAPEPVARDRLMRGESVDGGLYREVLEAHVRRLAWLDTLGDDDADRAELDSLVGGIFDDPGGSIIARWDTSRVARLREQRLGRGRPTGALDMLLREELRGAYATASRLAHGGDAPAWGAASTALEAVLREAYQPAELDQKLAGLNYPAWPPLPDRRVLVLVSVTVPRQTDGEAPNPLLDTIVAGEGDPSRLHLRLLATPTTQPNVPRWQAYAARLRVGSCAAYDLGEPNEASLEDLRATLTDLLRRDGDGLVTVGEVRVMAGPGPKVHNLAALLAAADLGLEACAPVQVVQTSRAAAGAERTVAVPEHRRLLHRLAHDQVLRGVATAALDNLDLRVAEEVLALGSPALRAEATEAAHLRRAFLARTSEADRDWLARTGGPAQAQDEELLLRARLRLIEEVLAGPDPWAAVFRADAALSTGLGRAGWNRLKDVSTAASRLAKLRNDSPYGHRVGRRVAVGRGERRSLVEAPPSPEDLRALFARVNDDVTRQRPEVRPDWDEALVEAYRRLRTRLGR